MSPLIWGKKHQEHKHYLFHGIASWGVSALVIDCLSLRAARGNLMQLLFSSITKSKQRLFGKISVCFRVILEEASAHRCLKDADKKVNKYIELIAVRAMFPCSLPGDGTLGLVNLWWDVLISKLVRRTLLCRKFDCFYWTLRGYSFCQGNRKQNWNGKRPALLESKLKCNVLPGL